MPRVLNKHRDGIPQGAVYIGRPSKWGNPFVMSEYGSREAVVRAYRQYLWNNKTLMAQLHELRGKDLVCYCAPRSCHGDVLLAAVEWDERSAQQADIAF